MKINTITICGGGSLGIVCAGVFLSKGIEVNMLTGHPEKWSSHIEVKDPNGKVYSGDLNHISSDFSSLIPSSDIILLCIPGFLIEKSLKSILPYINKNTVIGSVVSSTGFFFIAHKILPGNTKLFGFQRVPFISRYKEYGRDGLLLGYKSKIKLACENIENPAKFISQLEYLFQTPIELLDNYYEASLTNSNPILHTGRLYSMWKDYKGEVFNSTSLFYEDWTDDASETLIAMDREFMKIIEVLKITKDKIPSLLQYYESSDAQSLTKKIKSIEAFKNILSPLKKIESGWVPDFQSRYFIEDFPFGLKFILDTAASNNVNTPFLLKIYQWGMSKVRCSCNK